MILSTTNRSEDLNIIHKLKAKNVLELLSFTCNSPTMVHTETMLLLLCGSDKTSMKNQNMRKDK